MSVSAFILHHVNARIDEIFDNEDCAENQDNVPILYVFEFFSDSIIRTFICILLLSRHSMLVTET